MTDAKQLELEHAAWLARPARENEEMSQTWYELVWALNFEAGGWDAAKNTVYELIEPRRAQIEAMVEDTLDHAGIGGSEYYFLAYPGSNDTTISFGDAVNEIVFTEDVSCALSTCGDFTNDFWTELQCSIADTIVYCLEELLASDNEFAPEEYRLDEFTRGMLVEARSKLS